MDDFSEFDIFKENVRTRHYYIYIYMLYNSPLISIIHWRIRPIGKFVRNTSGNIISDHCVSRTFIDTLLIFYV